MRIDKLRKAFVLLTAVLASVGLAGCLGGEGSSSGSSGSSSGGSTTSSGKPTIVLALASGLPATSANAVTTVTFGSPIYAAATVTDGSGAAVKNAVVSFAAADAMIVFSPASATALTDANGVAWVRLDSASIADAGATSLSASAAVTTTSSGASTTAIYTSAPLGVAVNGSTVTLGALTLGQPSISAYGTSVLSVPVLINGAATNSPIAVSFSSPCATSGKATLSSPVTSVAGVATSTYKDNNCASGTDVITASVSGASVSTTLSVATPAANNMQFVSASPGSIGIQGAGSSLPQSSVVKFKVVDSSGNGKAGVLVDFSLLQSGAPSGIAISPTSASSDANGEVTTTVTSGTVPTPVSVSAKVHDAPSILSQSNTLTITTGLPAQDFFSLSVQTHNIEGLAYDGIESRLFVIASDRLGNPAPDGTAINFITEGGQIEPPSCTTASGACTVTFKSAQFKPANGRVTVLAYAVGEESFVDADGNNVYGPGETFHDLGDPFIDANENLVSDTGEQHISFVSVSAPVACLTRGVSGGGTAALPSNYVNAPSVTNSCDGAWAKNYVRRSAVIVLSGSQPTLSQTTFTMGSSCLNMFTFNLRDQNNNPMPAGTTVSIGANYVTYTEPGGTPTGATLSVDGTPVADAVAVGGTQLMLTVDGGTSCTGAGTYPAGTATVVVKTPQGLQTAVPVTVN